MTQATDTLEVAIINHFFRGVSQTATSGWVALYNGNPTDTAAAGTDVTTTVRPAGRVAAGFAAPTSGAGT
ncbi:MAG: hypothetical protein EBZ50_03120, partial [Alphaproteobacteria bacterium]|nr:hypothetical protein [Alphaproteobacteria bacterium]